MVLALCGRCLAVPLYRRLLVGRHTLPSRLTMDKDTLRTALSCKCPHCAQGDLYKNRYTLQFHKNCPSCGYDFAGSDSADGPAVFLIFILGFTIVPAALFLELQYEPPFWVHMVLWAPLVIALTVAFLRPVKSYVLALHHKYISEGK